MLDSKQKLIDDCFGLFKLDNRASQRELELAYDVLTKDKDIPNCTYQEYRFAFEFLMTEFFNATDDTHFNEDYHKEDYYTDEEHISNIVSMLPNSVKDGLNSIEKKTGSTLSEKARAILATQNVNLPMLFDCITKNCSKFLGFKFWLPKNIKQIIIDSCLNPLEYTTVYYEISYQYYASSDSIKDLQDFVISLEKYFNTNEDLCKRYVFHKSGFGVTGSAILESQQAEAFIDMITAKANQTGCFLNINTTE